MFLWWFQVFSLIMLKSLLNGRNILIGAVLIGFLYCYFNIQSKTHTITEQQLTISQQQLQIQQMTITRKQQQDIIKETTNQLSQVQTVQTNTIKVIEKHIIAPGCDNSIKYLKEEAENIKW